MKKVAIIGAGISGLLIANLFKKNPNYQVTVFEKNNKKNKDKYFLLKVYKKDQKYLLKKNTKFNFLKNLTIFPMEELSKSKNFNKNLNFKLSNMNMNIKIRYLRNSGKFQSPYWIDEKKLDNYMLPSFTKKIVKFLERN